MSANDDADERSRWFGNWLRSLVSPESILGKLVSLFGFGSQESDSSADHTEIQPYVSYSDIQNANATYQKNATPLEKARKALQDIRNGTFHYATGLNAGGRGAWARVTEALEDGPGVVREWLQRAGADASSLDPTGMKSATEMEAEISDAPRLGHIARARRYFGAIVSHGARMEDVGQGFGGLSDNPADIARLMQDELNNANQIAVAGGKNSVDVTALDPTGTKSANEMREEVHRRIVEGYVINARKEFYLLKNFGDDLSQDRDDKVQEWLNKANEAAKEYGFKAIDASTLDPSGKASAAEVNRDILKAIENKHLEKASLTLYWSQHGGFSNPATAAKTLNEELAAINNAAGALGEKPVSISMIDSGGGRYRERASRELEELAAGNLAAGVERLRQEHAAAQSAALQNEEALAALIHPLETPASPTRPPRRQK
jgi:hypothetical protein